jgi:hypothetical protein
MQPVLDDNTRRVTGTAPIADLARQDQARVDMGTASFCAIAPHCYRVGEAVRDDVRCAV